MPHPSHFMISEGVLIVPRFSPFPKINGHRGAPMGRFAGALDPDTPLKQLAIAGPAGEYDCGGAYWGNSRKEGPVWAVWRRGHGRDGVAYVRAHSQDAAKRKALEG